MRPKTWVLLGLVAVVAVALIVANRPTDKPQGSDAGQPVAQGQESASTPAHTEAQAPPATTQPVPHFHARLEDALPLPKILPASNFRIPAVARAYRIAARIPEVLAQQPCYCWCDKIGHGSLVDCFATDHGAG